MDLAQMNRGLYIFVEEAFKTFIFMKKNRQHILAASL